MTSSYISITQTVTTKLYARKKRFNSCSEPAKNFLSLPTISKTCIKPCFRLDSNTLIRSRTLGPEREEKSETEDDKEDCRAEETVLKLYTDIKNGDINGISEVIGDECQCFCNFSSTNRLLQGKMQVMAFFYWLMMKLGKDIKIIVTPTSKDGMNVGVQWQLEWEKPQIQLGKGFSFHICHIYQGKLLIKNVEMFMEPIIHMEPLRLRTMAFAVRLAEKIVTYLRPAENTRRQAMTFLLLALLLLAAAAFYFTRPRL